MFQNNFAVTKYSRKLLSEVKERTDIKWNNYLNIEEFNPISVRRLLKALFTFKWRLLLFSTPDKGLLYEFVNILDNRWNNEWLDSQEEFIEVSEFNYPKY